MAPGLLRWRLEQSPDEELAEKLARWLQSQLAPGESFELFVDTSPMASYETGFRTHLVGWFKDHKHRLRGLTVLVRSKLVEMGANVAAMLIGRETVHILSNPAEYQRLFSAASKRGAASVPASR